MKIFRPAQAIGLAIIAFSIACPCTGSARAPLLFAKLPANQVRTPQPRQLSLADRVAYQYAIEEVYWRHRIWPKENAGAKPPLDEVMSPADVRQKVENYLRNSQLLTEQRQQPITPELLQSEMERMARDTKQPEVLHELFSALGNDPAIIAECLARPLLAERLERELSGRDERYGKRPVKGERVAYPIAAAAKKTAVHEIEKWEVPEVVDVGGGYTLPGIGGSCTDNTWAATTTVNAPSKRVYHTAVWTGTEMIVWGGADENAQVNTGSRYDPATDSWAAITGTNAPAPISGHTAVWTGVEMIVWSGTQNGGRYNPGTNSWLATTTTNAPGRRQDYTAVWTGTEMIIWGGFFFDGGGITTLNTGGRYNPSTDSWVETSTTDAPIERQLHTAVWSGSEMIIWGGVNLGTLEDVGGRYNPITNSWLPTTTNNAPPGRADHTAVWTGSEMIVWGGFGNLITGGRYNPSTDSWLATTITNAPDGRQAHTAVWTGSKMIIWGGGANNVYLNTGSRYDPSTDGWVATTTTDAPVGRHNHTAVWTGSEMIAWGGGNAGGILNSGGRYCAPSSTLGNISTRMRVETGNNVLIGGFIINGTAPKNVVVRGIGPSLTQFGIPDALADPTLELRDSGGTLVRQNDNWQDDQSQASQLTALGFALQNSNESGMVASLSPAAYTAILAGKNGGTGVGLVEIYDTNSGADSQLANISTRGFVLTGTNVMIGGFILAGANNTHVAVRGIGPSLAEFGLSPVLADPTLELRDSNGALLVSNDDWQDDSASASQLTTLGLAPTNPAESGIHVSLSPGAFTAILAGKNGGAGIGLIEIYNVH